MKKLLLSLFCLTFFAIAKGQDILVSKPLVDAMNNGKFYMKLTGHASSEIAVKQNVAMLKTGGLTMMCCNGNSYMLNENQKTYTVSINMGLDLCGAFSGYKFVKQGKAKIKAGNYHFDEWKNDKGGVIRFFYNRRKVAAMQVDFSKLSGSHAKEAADNMNGMYSFASFNTKIPGNMYFCLSNDWKGTNVNQSVDATQDIRQKAMEKAMADISDDQLAEMEESMKEIEAMLNNPQLPAATKAHLKKSLEQAKMAIAMKKGGKGDAGKTQSTASSALNPPTCASPWVDNSTSTEYGAAEFVADVQPTEMTITAQSQYVYIKDFTDEVATPADKNLLARKEMTAEGLQDAFYQLKKEVDGMKNDEALAYVASVSSDCYELIANGMEAAIIYERAVAASMILPNAFTLNNAGNALLAYQDGKMAKPYFEAAAKHDPNNPVILTNIAECNFLAEDFPQTQLYLDRALAQNPDFGPALELQTSLYLAKGDVKQAATSLFKATRFTFSPVSAHHFNYLITMLNYTRAIFNGNNESPLKDMFEMVFTEENLRYLAEATKAGCKDDGRDKPANQKTFAFPKGVCMTYFDVDPINEKIKQCIADQQAMRDKTDKFNASENNLCVVLHNMGMLDYDQLAKSFEALWKKKAESGVAMVDRVKHTNYVEKTRQFFAELTGPVYQDDNAYRASLATTNRNGGSNLQDARQYWCLQMWHTYYDVLLERASGVYVELENGRFKSGWCSDKYKEYVNNQASIDAPKSTEFKILFEQEAADYKACEKYDGDAHYKCELAAQCKFAYNKYRLDQKYANSHLNCGKRYYQGAIQPILEEYWLRMNSMLGYVQSQAVIDYFEALTLADIEGYWHVNTLSNSYIWVSVLKADESGVEECDAKSEELEDWAIEKENLDKERLKREVAERLANEQRIQKEMDRLNGVVKEVPPLDRAIGTTIKGLASVSLHRTEGNYFYQFSLFDGLVNFRGPLNPVLAATRETQPIPMRQWLKDQKSQQIDPKEAEKFFKTWTKNELLSQAITRFAKKHNAEELGGLYSFSVDTKNAPMDVMDGHGNFITYREGTTTTVEANAGVISGACIHEIIRTGNTLRTKDHVRVSVNKGNFSFWAQTEY